MVTDTEYRGRFQLIGGIILAIVVGVPLFIGSIVGHGDPSHAAQTTGAERSEPPSPAQGYANRGDGTTPAGPAAPGTGPVDVSQPISLTTPGMPGTGFVPGGPPVEQYATVPGALPAGQFTPGTAETLASASLRSARSSFEGQLIAKRAEPARAAAS
jgi:hypothetical protein